MTNKEIRSDKAPAPIGPYAQAVFANGFLFISGQIGIDPAIGRLVDNGVEAQTCQVFANIQAILDEAGIDISHVVKTTIFLKDLSHFSQVNAIYGRHFQAPFPARSCVGVNRLPLDAEIEIETIAAF